MMIIDWGQDSYIGIGFISDAFSGHTAIIVICDEWLIAGQRIKIAESAGRVKTLSASERITTVIANTRTIGMEG